MAHYLARLDPDGPEPDPTATRSCTISSHPDGRVTGRFDLDPAGGEKVRAAIESSTTAHRPAGDLRTRAQQQADALVQWADATLATGQAPRWRGVRPHLAVKVELADLLDPAAGPGAARLGFGAILSAARARVGRLRRRPHPPRARPRRAAAGRRAHRAAGAAGLRKAVEARDGGWCSPAATHRPGGARSTTSCLQIHTGYRIERRPDGTWRTWRPDGTEILLPALLTDSHELARAG